MLRLIIGEPYQDGGIMAPLDRASLTLRRVGDSNLQTVIPAEQSPFYRAACRYILLTDIRREHRWWMKETSIAGLACVNLLSTRTIDPMSGVPLRRH